MAVTTFAFLVLGAEDLEVERLDRRAGGAAEQAMTLEHVVEPLLLDHPERDVERHEDRHRRRERAVRRVLALALQRLLPVEVVAAARRRGGAARARARSARRSRGRAGTSTPSANRPRHVDAPLVLRARDGAEAGDGVDHDDRAGGVRHLGQRLDVVDDARRRLATASCRRPWCRACSASARSTSAGSTLLPQLGVEVVNSAPKAAFSSTQRSPNLPHEATRAGPAGARLATADSMPPDPDDANTAPRSRSGTTLLSRSRQRA